MYWNPVRYMGTHINFAQTHGCFIVCFLLRTAIGATSMSTTGKLKSSLIESEFLRFYALCQVYPREHLASLYLYFKETNPPKIHPADQIPRTNQTFVTYLKYQTSGKQDTERRCLAVLQLLPVAVPHEEIHGLIDWMKISACVVSVICSGGAPIGCWAVALCPLIGRPLGSSCAMTGSHCFLPVAFI